MKKAISIILLGVTIMLCFSGCKSNYYKVDYCGEKDFYTNAKDSYKAGTTVTLYYDLIATDTDYSFYLDDERINVGYKESKGFIIEFVMPEHDVKLKSESRNTMEYIPDVEE